MDGNKVQSLRQQFEVLSNFTNDSTNGCVAGKSDIKYASPTSVKMSGPSNNPHHQWYQMDPQTERSAIYSHGSIENNIVSKAENRKTKVHGSIVDGNRNIPCENPGKESNVNGVPSDGLFVSGNRRNGIYVSNSVTLHTDAQLMHRESRYSLPHNDSGMRNEGGVLNSAVGSELENRACTTNNNIPYRGRNSLDKDIHSQHTLENDLANTHISNSESHLNTHQSSASNSTCSSSGVYGRVKRSNAFRQKDLVDCVDSRFVKTKLVLERVKSLDGSATNGSPNSANGEASVNERSAQRAASVCLRPSHSHIQSPVYEPSKSSISNSPVVNPYHRLDSSQLLNAKPGNYLPAHFDNRDQNRPPPVPSTPSPSSRQPTALVNPQNSGVIMADAQYGILSENQFRYANDFEKGNHKKLDSQQVTLTKEISVPQPPVLPKCPPPEKPPRTFLYDILSDNQNTNKMASKNEKSSFGLSGTSAKTANANNQLTPTSTRFHMDHPFSANGTNNKSSSNPSKNNTVKTGKIAGNATNEDMYVFATANVSQSTNPAKIAKTHPQKTKVDVSKNEISKCHNTSRPIGYLIAHPMLARSKTESQIIMRNKNRLRPTAMDVEMANSASDIRLNGRLRQSVGIENTAFAFDESSLEGIRSQTHRNTQFGLESVSNTSTIKNSQSSSLNSNHKQSPNVDWINYSSELDSVHSILPHEYQTNPQTYLDANMTLRESCSNDNVSQPHNEEHLSTKSKSEWALNQVGCSGNSRRNTVATVAHMPNVGYPSLDSTISSNSSTNTQNSSKSNPNKHFRSGIQHSIQNLMNQLFPTGTVVKDATSSTDSGIQLGSDSLSSSDTPMGDSTTDTGDSDCENDMELSNVARQVVEARKGYIRRVSSIRMQELGASLHRMIQNSKKPTHNGEPLFECLVVVGLNRDPYKGTFHPYIREIYPSNVKLADGVEQFCFPDSLEWPCHEGVSAQFYTLAITDQRGSRKYGCCYRILPEGATICIPITYCLISSHRAIGFYKEVLREITSRHGLSEYQKHFWMEELYKRPFPNPGDSITVQEPIVEEIYHDGAIQYYKNLTVSPKSVTLRRRVDHRLDEGDLVTLLSTIDLSIVIKLFGSLLLERKVVLISRALSNLSLCLEALESMLYPFTWQHTFVPILPLSMTDVLDAPAPFLMGVLRSSQTPWDKTLDDGIVVDLDGNKVLSCVGDEATILPKRINRKLKDALQLVLNLADQKESTKNVLISECFIRMFAETLGHFSSHFIVQQDGMKIFDRENFTKHCDSKATQNFLEWFSETSMFHEFLELRLKGAHKYGIFEQRIMEQSEQSQLSSAAGTLSLKNAKLFMKGSKPFGSWLKEAFVMK